jgi:2'-5' RNA ligase
MSVIRAFIAIDLTPEIRSRLDKVAAQFKERLGSVPVRWAPAGNIHLTLKFLGDVSVNNLEMLKKMLAVEVARHHRFELSVGGVGAFPSTRRARVIWAGVEAPQQLFTVQNGIETEMAHLGYAREEREFAAHLTLGRVSRNATPGDARQIGDALEKIKVGFLGAATAREVHLYKSDLHPDGAVYARLFSAPLGE